MKKILFKVMTLSVMLLAMPGVFVGCKDYDEDIVNLGNSDDQIKKEFNEKLAQQLAALQAQEAALKQLETELKAQIEAAKAALENAAKEDHDKFAAQIAATEARLDQIESTLADLEAAKATIQGQISDIYNKYQDLIDKVNAAATKGDLQALQNALDSYKEDVTSVLDEYLKSIEANKTAIADICGQLEAIGGMEESIKELQSQYQTTKNDVDYLLTAVNGLEEKYQELSDNYNDYVAKYTSLETALNMQQQALDNFNGEIGNVKSDIQAIQADLQDIKAALADLAEVKSALQNCATKQELSALESAFNQRSQAVDSHFETVEGEITKLQKAISDINADLSTLNLKNAKRLTSVTLIPEAYVGGIPSIEFYSATYHALAAPTEGIYGAASTTATPIPGGLTKVSYRLNPTGVSINDIVSDELSFVQQVATSRAAADDVVSIATGENAQPTIENGVLTVYVVKNTEDNIDNAGAGKIYTVALRVPIAEGSRYKWTENGQEVTESAEDAVVYSEYSRIADTNFTPKVAATEEYAEYFKQTSVFHLWDNTLYNGAPVDENTIKVPFNAESFDLSTVATGCMEYTYNGKNIDMLMDAVQLESYGFTLEYSVPSKAYEVDGVNQQVYASVAADGTLTPLMPEGQTAFSRVGKTPIVSVVLKHGNDVVDQRFFMVEYTINADATTFEFDVFKTPLSCEAITSGLTWKQLIEQVVTNEAKLGFPLNKEEFVANYEFKEFDGDGAVTVDLSAADNVNPIVWTIGLDQYKNLGGKDADKTVTLVFSNKEGLFPDITIVLNGTIQWPTTLPTLGSTLPAYWNNGVMQVLPLAMPENWKEGDDVVAYNTNILIGRPAPYLINLFDCANWDLQFSGVSDNAFKVNSDELPALTGTGAYEVVMDTEVAATITHEDADFAPFSFTADDAAQGATLVSLPFVINHNDAGIAMVDKQMTVDLTWYVALNGLENENFLSLNNTHLKVIAPLKSLNLGAVEPVQQLTTSQTRNLTEGLTITDVYNAVFNSEASEWGYYAVQTPVFDTNPANMKITENATDDPVTTGASLDAYKMQVQIDATGENFVFVGGEAALLKPVYLNIKVSVAHQWGTLEDWVQIQINPRP